MKNKMNLIPSSTATPKILKSMGITKIYEYCNNIFDEAIKKKSNK